MIFFFGALRLLRECARCLRFFLLVIRRGRAGVDGQGDVPVLQPPYVASLTKNFGSWAKQLRLF